MHHQILVAKFKLSFLFSIPESHTALKPTIAGQLRKSITSAISFAKIGRNMVRKDCFLLSTQPQRRRQQILSSYCERDSTDYFLSHRTESHLVPKPTRSKKARDDGSELSKNRYNRFKRN
jgi:hypothetical protein